MAFLMFLGQSWVDAAICSSSTEESSGFRANAHSAMRRRMVNCNHVTGSEAKQTDLRSVTSCLRTFPKVLTPAVPSSWLVLLARWRNV